METVEELNYVFKNKTYENINKYGSIKLRNIKDCLSLQNVILFNFLYVQKSITIQNIVNNFKFMNKNKFL